MLIFSTRLPVKASLTARQFMDLVIEWNQKSPFDAISDLEWDGQSYQNHWEADNRTLDTVQAGFLVAARFCRTEKQGLIWTTEFILDEEHHEVGVYLNREADEGATYFQVDFKPPYLIKLLIRKGFIDYDNGMGITHEPILFGKDETELRILAELSSGKTAGFSLPIIYLTRDRGTGCFSVDPKYLAIDVQGVAHVFLEADTNVSWDLKKLCDSQNVYNGGIAIFYPSHSAEWKRFAPSPDWDSKWVLKRLVSAVFSYMNQQKRGELTWDSVQSLRLKEQIESASQKMKKTKQENNDIWDALGTAYNQIDALTRDKDRLMAENQALRGGENARGEKPLLYYGREKDFYADEILEFVVAAIQDHLDKMPQTDGRHRYRGVDVLRDILAANKIGRVQAQRAGEIKNELKGYVTLTKPIQRVLENVGFIITSDGKHHKLTYYGDERYVTTMSKTGSDKRAGNNLASQIKKMIYDL